jgi:cobalt-zinc-cadmium resistance protein CzcA
MVARLIAIALRFPWAVMALVALIAAAGYYAFCQLPIDAYPDISGTMVQIIATYPGKSPEQVEREVTIPIERALLGVPRARTVRSRTIFGLTVVQALFEDGVEDYWARQRVAEYMNNISLPPGADAEMAPLMNAYGEILRYELVSDGTHDLFALRELNDWVVIPALRRVPGVADVNNFGGLQKQYAITFRPADLDRFGLTINDVVDAIRGNNSSAGGSLLQQGSMAYVIRGAGAIQSLADIENTFVKSVDGFPVFVKDVASVGIDSLPPQGIFSRNHRDSSVEGIVVMRRGENPSRVLARVQATVAELNQSRLPQGVRIVPFYDRQHLVDRTLETVSHSVLLGITLVVLALLLFFGRPSIAALVACTIPFALLFALVLMYLTGIPIGLLSIGAIDFGIIVDGAIVVADNIARRLKEAFAAVLPENANPTASATQAELVGMRRFSARQFLQIVLSAALEVERSVFFSMAIIIAAYIPLLSLTSIEGLLFRPMALTMVFALLGALIFALFVVPVVCLLLYRRGYSEWENPVLTAAVRLYTLSLRGLLACRWLVVAAAVAFVGWVSLRIAPRLGIEFLPYIDEGVIWVRANFPEGISLERNNALCRRFREIVLTEFPDIQGISVQSGRNDSGTDPFPPSRNEILIYPRPYREWQQFRSKAELVAALGKRFREEFPTVRFNFTQPIIDSVTEDTNGTSANLAVEFTGPDSDVLLQLAEQTVELLKSIPGSQDVYIEQEGPQPQLLITPDRQLCARYNVRIEDVATLINVALGGESIAKLYEGERFFEIVVRVDRWVANSPRAIGRLPVRTADGNTVPLSQVARIEVVDGQTIIARENGWRRKTVRCDIVGRDQGGFVREAQEKFDRLVQPHVPPGYRVAWLGMFENLDRARRHFLFVIPITVAIIAALLFTTFASVRITGLLLLSVPFAFTGGVLALWWRQMNLNVSTGVGFAALFGMSMMNGIILLRAIRAHQLAGHGPSQAILLGAQECFRPILLASLVAILGLLPASLATGLGSDVQRPLATVIVWGLMSSTLLTLFVLPVAYYLLAPPVAATRSEDWADTGEAATLVATGPDRLDPALPT